MDIFLQVLLSCQCADLDQVKKNYATKIPGANFICGLLSKALFFLFTFTGIGGDNGVHLSRLEGKELPESTLTSQQGVDRDESFSPLLSAKLQFAFFLKKFIHSWNFSVESLVKLEEK